jgi:predicted amidophosphoribosyltransferase
MCCGNNLVPLVITMATTPEKINQQQLAEGQGDLQILCHHCGNKNPVMFNWCPACGSALRPQPCAYCGQMLDMAATICSHCGAPPSRKI